MAVSPIHVFSLNYDLKEGGSFVNYTAYIAAYSKEEAEDHLRSILPGRIQRVNSIGTGSRLDSISDTVRNKIIELSKPKEEIKEEVETIEVYKCPYTGNTFKTPAAFKAHLTKLNKKK